jgi:hypothetical protein
MGPKVPAHEVELALFANEQHGVVAAWQLVALGFSRRQISVRAERGRLHRLYRGVYAVGHAALSREARDIAAVLACGPGALLSHWSATARWELLRPTGGWPHVSTSLDRRVRRIETHHVRPFHASDQAQRDGIPVTSVPRTLLDLAGVADERILRRAVNEAVRRKRLDAGAAWDVIERHPRRKGTKALRAVLAAVDPQTGRTRSDLEVAFLAFCRRRGVETPVVNGRIEGYEVDMHWPGSKLIAELDDYEYHRTPVEFENDRRRDARLKARGYTVIRVTGAWLDEDPTELAELVRAHVGVDRVL